MQFSCNSIFFFFNNIQTFVTDSNSQYSWKIVEAAGEMHKQWHTYLQCGASITRGAFPSQVVMASAL